MNTARRRIRIPNVPKDKDHTKIAPRRLTRLLRDSARQGPTRCMHHDATQGLPTFPEGEKREHHNACHNRKFSPFTCYHVLTSSSSRRNLLLWSLALLRRHNRKLSTFTYHIVLSSSSGGNLLLFYPSITKSHQPVQTIVSLFFQ